MVLFAVLVCYSPRINRIWARLSVHPLHEPSGRPVLMRPRLPGAMARAPLVASLTPFDRYELGFRQRHRNAAPVVFALNPPGYTRPRVRVTPVSYWAGVAGGGSGFTSLRTSLLFPVPGAKTCKAGRLVLLK